ncbi:polyprotein [Tobacco vein clearing virus]|uniref:RNA-directed DNA polymerase n=1 Tax=Tobacco vein clearing virus TaxID=107324 RepID=Q9QD04_9VIRU|nr:polyprotein [Tobacco vein clearing virus]AAF08289.1 polyprotein [Tobacco vein clearing virus]
MKIYILAKIIVEGYYNRYYTPMIDTGAEANICKYNCLPTDKWEKLKTPMVVTGFNNEGSMINYKARNVKIQIWDKILTIEEIYNFEFTTKDMLLGMPFLEKLYPHIITKTHWWFTTPCKNKVGAKRVNNKQRKTTEWIRGSEKITQKLENINKNTTTQLEIIIFTIDKVKIIQKKLEKLYNDNPLQGWEKHKTKVKIELIEENSIITQKPLKYNFNDLTEFKIHIKDLLDNKYIQESNSKHTSPAFIVNKHSEQKRGKSRMVIDYRNLNAKTKTYNYPIPNKILKIRQIQGYNYFSKFDCKSGFYHLKLEDESKKLTAFTVPQGFYEWNVLPFGYKNAPGRYQHFMDNYFNQLENCIVYIDDILLYSRTQDEHIKLLEKFAHIIENSGISLSKTKAEIMKNQIEFLGIQIDKNGIKMQTHIVQKIINLDENIDTKKKLQSFLGIVNQVREYIPKLAENLKPLQKKLKKDVEYSFDEKDKEQIKKIKILCKKLPKLYFPDENKKFTYIVETDSSNYSYGGVLKYRYNKEKIEHHCRYYSGSYTEPQEKWEINRKELFALYKCLLAFEPYIVYTRFIVRTDNTQVKWWITRKVQDSVTTKEIRRLVLNILNFTFTIEIINTNKNVVADYLSRQSYPN